LAKNAAYFMKIAQWVRPYRANKLDRVGSNLGVFGTKSPN